MPEPVLVIHGVANRDRAAFKNRVGQLNERVGDRWTFLPVFWGDLGADADEDLFAALPVLNDRPGLTVRAAEELSDLALERLVQDGLGDANNGLVRAQEGRLRFQEEHILVGVANRTRALETTVRNLGGTSEADQVIREVVQRQLPTTHYLRHVDDPAVLEAVGRVLGDAVQVVENEGIPNPGAAVRGAEGDEGVFPYGNLGREDATRGVIDLIGRKATTLLDDLDELIGRSVGGALGRVNQLARQVVGQGMVRFFGDIIVYSRHRDKIHDRLWQAIADWQGPGWQEPSYGSEQRPINVIGHSLGGVAAFDAALSQTRPLWIKSMVTFGSQAAFFHTVDQREELAKFTHGHPVALPQTIGKWTNLWEPMDLVAFTAGAVFRFEPNAHPSDIRVDSGAREIWDAFGWTHSAYWESDEIVEAIHRTLIP